VIGMTDTTTTDTATLVDTYFEMWRTTDAEQRAALVADTFTTDGRHVDQHADATGHDELVEMITGVHAGFPGFQMARTSGIDRFGDQLRFAWELNGADGTPIVAGLDVAEVASDGRLQRVTGFWGDLPAD
jgi:SnoaL-like domain